jgi:transposase
MMEAEESRKRRRYSAHLKAQILAECAAPGASVAKVAMSHGVNANIVHGWRKLARQAVAAPPLPTNDFIPVTVAEVAQERAEQRSLEVELRRGTITVKLQWPMSAAADLAAWMRELLR